MDPSVEVQARRDLGRVLAALREAAGYRQQTLAPLTGYSRSTLANVETGRQRVPRSFWVRCDNLLGAGGHLVAQHDRIEAGRHDHRRVGAEDILHRFAADGGTAAADSVTVIKREEPGAGAETAGTLDHLDSLIDAAADDGLANAAIASAGLDRLSLTDVFEQVADIARGYANRHRWETFRRARSSRDLAHDLAARTRRPSDLVDVYLLTSLSNALMASAAFDLARWPAAVSLARAARTFADLSGNPSAIAWARGLLATLMNWHDRPDTAVREIEGVFAARPGRTAQYRLYGVLGRAHALRGDRSAAKDALESAARCRPDEGRGRDLLHDEIGGEFSFDPARAAACAGAAWLQLRDGAAAERVLSGALAGYAVVPARDRPAAPVTGARLDLAAARLLRSDVQAAAEALAPVFDIPPEQRISVLSGRMATVQQMLHESDLAGTAEAHALADRISDWLIPARPAPSALVS